jgi:hypothetical protein
MTEERVPLAELVQKADGGNFRLWCIEARGS